MKVVNLTGFTVLFFSPVWRLRRRPHRRYTAFVHPFSGAGHRFYLPHLPRPPTTTEHGTLLRNW